MAVISAKPLRAAGLRITKTDNCGVVVDTTTELNSQVVMSDFISLAFSPEISAGEVFEQRAASGNICISDRSDPDKLLGFNVTLGFCGLPSHIVEFLLGGTSITRDDGQGGTDIVGGILPATDLDTATQTSTYTTLEVWARNSDKSACNQGGGFNGNYVRYIFPLVYKWQISSDITFANDIINFELTAFAEQNENWTSPLTVASDPDLDVTQESAIAAGGAFSYLLTDTVPTAVQGYTNPS